METERIALSQRERERLKVLHDVQQKQLTQAAAAERLRVTDRHVRRMLLRRREVEIAPWFTDCAAGHRTASWRPAWSRRFWRACARCADFGPTLAAEHLAQEGFSVSRETLRKWMTQAALWRPRAQRVKAVHVCRERRASFGELVMQDSSPFRWLEERGPACHLIALIDDATSRIWDGSPSTTPRKRTSEPLEGWLGSRVATLIGSSQGALRRLIGVARQISMTGWSQRPLSLRTSGRGPWQRAVESGDSTW